MEERVQEGDMSNSISVLLFDIEFETVWVKENPDSF